jgi:hypothetical protein
MIHSFMSVGCVMEDFNPPGPFEDPMEFEEFAHETYAEFQDPAMYDSYVPDYASFDQYAMPPMPPAMKKRLGDHMAHEHPPHDDHCGPDGCPGEMAGTDMHPPPPVCLLPCIEAAGVRRRQEGELTPEEICGFLDHLFATDQCVGDCDEFESEMIHSFMSVGCVMEDFSPPGPFEDPTQFEEFAHETYAEFQDPAMYDHYMPAGTYDHYMPAGTYDHEMPAGTYGHEMPAGTYDHEMPAGTYDHEMPAGTYGHEMPAGTYDHEIPAGTYGHEMPPMHPMPANRRHKRSNRHH